MDGWMDGWVNGWMDGRTDGWMDGQTTERTPSLTICTARGNHSVPKQISVK